tara:strand:+ start:7352 stop:8257 length:906 start_codon:yes stop_codon:yes gene_type:complete
MKKIYTIDDNYVDTRLDRWFKKVIEHAPQSFIEKNLRKGNIKVNNKKVKNSYKLQLNDKIVLFNIKFTKKKQFSRKEYYNPTKKEVNYSSDLFIHSNNDFVVLNKPSGIAVQSGTKSKRNILDILRKTKEFIGSMPYPVHRIDKETTGVLIVAKNRKYAQLFTSLFRIRKINKTYLCIVVGEFQNKSGTFVDNLIHYEGDKKTFVKAITHFEVIDSNNNFSLLKLNPETGRKHQLRKQLLIHGYPVLGDNKYRLSLNKKKGELMLHAYKINFSINDVKYNFLAKPHEPFIKTLKEKYLKIS